MYIYGIEGCFNYKFLQDISKLKTLSVFSIRIYTLYTYTRIYVYEIKTSKTKHFLIKNKRIKNWSYCFYLSL